MRIEEVMSRLRRGEKIYMYGEGVGIAIVSMPTPGKVEIRAWQREYIEMDADGFREWLAQTGWLQYRSWQELLRNVSFEEIFREK